MTESSKIKMFIVKRDRPTCVCGYVQCSIELSDLISFKPHWKGPTGLGIIKKSLSMAPETSTMEGTLQCHELSTTLTPL